jgi:arginine repressor
METAIKITVAANITYSGLTYNTPLIIEYEHTGKRFEYKKKYAKYPTVTESEELAEEAKKQGLKVTQKNGYYFIKRLAIPTINAKGQKDIWYINNQGDSYSINKVSKYAKKIHLQLSKEQNQILN